VEARLVCVECGASADWAAEGWEAHLVPSDSVEAHGIGAEHDGPDRVFIFCPDCAWRPNLAAPAARPPRRRALLSSRRFVL
jgi:hypothetical protein